jgi:hypothetical protein
MSAAADRCAQVPIAIRFVQAMNAATRLIVAIASVLSAAIVRMQRAATPKSKGIDTKIAVIGIAMHAISAMRVIGGKAVRIAVRTMDAINGPREIATTTKSDIGQRINAIGAMAVVIIATVSSEDSRRAAMASSVAMTLAAPISHADGAI